MIYGNDIESIIWVLFYDFIEERDVIKIYIN